MNKLFGEMLMGEVHWYLPVSQVAELLGCHWRKVYELIAEGVLEFIQLGPRKVRVSEASVQKYLEMTCYNDYGGKP